MPAARRKAGAPVRVAIYLRVSTEEQAKGFGLKAQEALCRRWLDFKYGPGNYVIVGIYSDDGISGKLDSRPRYDEMNVMIAGSGCDIVIFGKLDRIGRTMKEIHRWTYDTTERGIRVATADGRIDSEDELFEVVLSLMAYMAQLEHTLIMERTAQGREQKAMAGGWPLGNPPYGVMLEGKEKTATPVLCPYEVEVLKQVHSCMVHEGMNYPETADRLNTLGYVTRKGKPWSGDNLSQRLKTTAFDGYAEFRIAVDVDEDDEDAEPFKVFRIPIPCPLPEKMVSELREAMGLRARPKSAHRKYHLSGRITGMCSGVFTGYTRPDTGVSYYKCNGKRRGLKCTCSEVPATELESAVWREIEPVFDTPGRFREIVTEWMGTTPARIASYERRIAEIDSRIEEMGNAKKASVLALLEKLASENTSQDLDLSGLKGTFDDIKADLAEKGEEEFKKLTEEKQRVQEWLKDANAQIEQARELVTAVDKMTFNMETATWEEKSEILKLLDISVSITGEGVSHRKGIADPLTEWHRTRKRMVPVRITDKDWATVADLLPPSPNFRDGAREVFEAVLHKLRSAEKWTAVLVSKGGWASVYRRAKLWHESGAWEAAMNRLRALEGVPVPSLYTLPPMVVTGSVDPQYTSLELIECTHGADCDKCNEARTEAQAARFVLGRLA
jgi:DNA invertase Pin-like site-specific DNA recombinase/transposase